MFSLGMNSLTEEKDDERGIRFNTLHVRGVNDMSTQRVFAYFAEFAPSAIEWVDDASCTFVLCIILFHTKISLNWVNIRIIKQTAVAVDWNEQLCLWNMDDWFLLTKASLNLVKIEFCHDHVHLKNVPSFRGMVICWRALMKECCSVVEWPHWLRSHFNNCYCQPI